MKKPLIPVFILVLTATFGFSVPGLRAQGTGFTYQGLLNSAGAPANGSYDIAFSLFATNANGVAIAGPVTNTAVGVTNGLFTTLVDFGNVYVGESNWLQIAVSTNTANVFSTLSPRQQLTPTPYAITAENVSGAVDSSALGGTYGNAVTLNNANNSFTGSFAGNGASVSNVNASSLNGVGATNFWQLKGNNVNAGNFLGSTNNQPVELWVNNTRAFRLEPTSNDVNHSALVNVVGGSAANSVQPGTYGAVIGGGGATNYGGNSGGNVLAADLSVIGGGLNNSIQTNSIESFLGGGYGNFIQSNAVNTVLVGGYANSIQSSSGQPSQYASIVGGNFNLIQPAADYSTIGRGLQNTIGTNNVAVLYATVPGGNLNYAGGNYSFAAGQRAKANFQGDFVWADSQAADFNSTSNDQFLVRAKGGVGINTGNPGTNALAVSGNINATSFSGNGAGLTGLNLTLGQLPPGVVTNNESGVSLNNFTVNGSFSLLSFPTVVNAYTYFLGTLSAGNILIVDTNDNYYAGPLAGNSHSTGSYNTGIGTVVLLDNASGSGNTALGSFALLGNTSGSSNVSVGVNTMLANYSGSNNVAIGDGALQSSTNDSGLVAIGFEALQNVNLTNFNLTFSGFSENTAIGYQALRGDTVGLDNTAVGYLALNSTRDGIGNAALGSFALESNTNGGYNVAIGYIAMANSLGDSDAVAVGDEALGSYSGTHPLTTSGYSENTAIGGLALFSDTTGYGNTGVGFGSLNGNQTGKYNTADGDLASEHNVSGSGNTAMGAQALQSSTNDSDLVAIGYQAMLNDNAAGQGTLSGFGENTAVGYKALGANTVGTDNTALGFQALYTTTSSGGSENTAIGAGALAALGYNGFGSPDGGGTNNVAVGVFAGGTLALGNNNIYIGNPGPSGTATEYNTIRIGVQGLQTATRSSAPRRLHRRCRRGNRNAKENFQPVDSQAVLAKVAALPVTQWNYKDSRTAQHIGPVAQDFQAVFGLNGGDNKHISVVDEGGVALAAIQGLNEKVEGRSQKEEDQIAELWTENAELKQELSELKALVKQMAQAPAATRPAVSADLSSLNARR